jgi:hypothetical protein
LALGALAVGRKGDTPSSPDDLELLAQEKLYLEEEVHVEKGFERIIGKSEALTSPL